MEAVMRLCDLLLLLLPLASTLSTAVAAEPSAIDVAFHSKSGAIVVDARGTDRGPLTVLLRSRHVAHCPPQRRCILNTTQLAMGTRAPAVAVYTFQPHSGFELVHLAREPEAIDHLPAQSLTVQVAAAKRPRMSVYFSVEGTPKAQTYINMTRNAGGTSDLLTVERVIQQRRNLSDYCPGPPGPHPVQCAGIYHAVPLVENNRGEFYCYYRARPGEAGLAQDCANISANAAWHAATLHGAGIDILVPDTTNLDTYPDPKSDLLNIRPVEVLFEEFHRLREAGQPTPDIAVWTVAGSNSTMYTGMLPIYQNTTLSTLIPRNVDGKKVYFVDGRGNAHGPDPDVIAAIQADGGRHDVTTVGMWANNDVERAQTGEWTFFQPCQSNTSADAEWVNTILPDVPCNHRLTTNSSFGSQMSAAFSWQTNHASPPWDAPSKLMGLTFQKQFDDILRAKPDNILIPSYNEWIPTYARVHDAAIPLAFGSVGLLPEEQGMLALDGHGVERSRAWEPTSESGDFYLRLVESCVRVAALKYTHGGDACDVSGELCCSRENSFYNHIYSLVDGSASDYVLTRSAAEVERLAQRGYRQICAGSLNPKTTIFCRVAGPTSGEFRRGPFILYSNATIPAKGTASELERAPRVPIYRCKGSNGHCLATNANCDGRGHPEQILGYGAQTASTAMPRALRRCCLGSSPCYHTTDAYCQDAGAEEALLAYVL